MSYETNIKISRGDSGFIWDVKSHLIAKKVKAQEISLTDYYWHVGMTEWKRVSEFPFDNPPVVKTSFFQRLNELICIFWAVLNFFYVIVSIYLCADGRFKKHNIIEQDYKNGLLILLFGYLIIYALYCSITYLFTGLNLLRDYMDNAAGGFLVIGTILAGLHLWLYIW
jgi:hypothetical protein